MALLAAAQALATPERGATLRELAAASCVGLQAARHTVGYLSKSGALVVARTRRVPYRNKPVAEWVPAQPVTSAAPQPAAHALAGVLATWHASPVSTPQSPKPHTDSA
ncbi:MAG TPA: hypothetical protein VIP31_08045 [Acidovorax sp.]